jgi:hypothetical protein
MATGTYRNISGNLALSYGLVAASVRSGLQTWAVIVYNPGSVTVGVQTTVYCAPVQ